MAVMKLLLTPGLLLVLVALSSAQTGMLLSGTVTDPSGSVIPGASIILTSANGTTEACRTDERGIFRFAGLAPGSFQVRVEHTGFIVATVPVRIGGRSPRPMEIRLRLPICEKKSRCGTQVLR